MISIGINNDSYFLKWNLRDMKRLERIFGNALRVLSLEDTRYNGAVGLLWTGLYQENTRGELEHCFNQTVSGMEQAAAMLDTIQKEHPNPYEERSFVKVMAYRALLEDEWLDDTPSETNTNPVSMEDIPNFDTIGELYDYGARKTAYGLVRLKPHEFESLTPKEFFAISEAVIDDRKNETMKTDIMLATVKQVILATMNVNLKVQDLLVWPCEPESKVQDEDASVNVFKQWVTVSGGKTI